MQETYSGMLARTLPELDERVLNAIACENHWHEVPGRWREENRRSALSAIRVRAEDAGTTWEFR